MMPSVQPITDPTAQYFEIELDTVPLDQIESIRRSGMAFSLVSPRRQTARRSILILDKSSEPFRTQISDACTILGIRIEGKDRPLPSLQQVQEQIGSFDPREEWALRWLLKKLQSDDIHPGSPCLEPTAWLLLHSLVARLPVTNVARLLSTFKFTTIVKDTFQWLQQEADVGRGSLPQDTEDALARAESSSATLEVSPIDSPQKSRKRERDGTPISSSKSSATADPGIKDLYTSICSTVREVEALTRDTHDGARGFAVEHMKASLKSASEHAAAALGSFFTVTNITIQKSNGQSAEVFDECLNPMLSMWNLRSDTMDDPSGQSSSHAFRMYCMLPLLQLLITYQKILPSTLKGQKVVGCLEDLLAKYIILPARASFLNSKRTKAGSDKDPSSVLHNDLSAPLSKIAMKEAEDISPITVLYSVAIECNPRGTAKQRVTEHPWLQYLFSQLSESLSLASSSQPTLDEGSMCTLKALLHEAIKHNISLDIALLTAFLSKYSGLFPKDGGLNIVDWDLVGLCIRLNPDVFVLRSPQRASNALLTALFTRITERFFDPLLDRGDKYEKVLSGIILSLVQAFADARDLPRFIDCWKGELARFEETMEELKAELSIWEDSRLCQKVSDLISSALTAGQIEQILIAAHNGLTLLVATKETRPLSSLVVLDSAINGCISETIIVKLTDTARSIYVFLLEIASDEKCWDTPKRWKFWRVMTTINARWLRTHVALEDNPAEQHALRRALELINCKNSKANYAEEIHCFHYIMSFAAVKKHGSENMQRPPNHIVRQAFDIVLSHQQISSDFLSSEDWVASRHNSSAPNWNGQSNEVASVEILMMICQAQALTSPEILHCLDTDTHHRLFQQLFRGAVWQSMSSGRYLEPTPPSSLDYASLWQWLLCSDAIAENLLAADCCRKSLVSEYLSSAPTPGSGKAFATTRHQLALESLQYIPAHVFDRKERTALTNQTLHEIIRKTSDNMTMTKSVTLLLKLVAIPNRSMSVLTKLDGLDVEEQIGKERNVPSVLLSFAHKLDTFETEINVSALRGLKHLAEEILKYQVSTINERQSTVYLIDYYQQVTDEVGHKTKTSKGGASAVLLSTSLDFYHHHYNEFPQALKHQLKSLMDLRWQHRRSLYSHLDDHETLSELGTRKILSIILECLISDVASICTDAEQSAVTSRLLRIQTELADLDQARMLKVSGDKEGSVDYLSTRLNELSLLLELHSSELSQQLPRARTLLENEYSLRETRHLIRHLGNVVSKFNLEQVVELLITFTNHKKHNSFEFTDLLLLQRVIPMLKDFVQGKEQAMAALSRVYNALCMQLSQPIEFRTHTLTMQCMHLLLYKHPRTLSQWNIDNTLTTIAVVSSRLRLETRDKHTGMLYLGLCRLFATILAIHRKKLGGRYHLILPAIQGLLRSLFIPYARDTVSGVSHLANDVSLVEAHAGAFARLLTMLCSPTVSAVSHSRNSRQQELNDETKKARSIAGQHLHYLIMEYCSCQLKGRLLPEVKTALNPGIWAVLDVVQQEVMRTMNAAMDPASRSIFKALYEDYRRVGGGKGS